MRLFGNISVGIVALLGSLAHAQVPVNEVHASWQGCDYAVKVVEVADPDWPYYYRPFYKISVQSAVLSSPCTLTPGSVELATSRLTPDISIAVNDEGLAVAYSSGEYVRTIGPWVRSFIHSLNPSTLASLKVVGLQSNQVPPNGYAGLPGAAYVSGLWLGSGPLEVYGSFTGNSLTEYPAVTPWPYPIVQGSHFIVVYYDFFSPSSQSPFILTY